MDTTIAFCGHCGRASASADLVTVAGVPVCAACKPSFLRRLQEGVPTAASPALHYRGFWIRFVAKILDGLVLMAILTPLWIMAFRSTFTAGLEGRPAPDAANFVALSLLMDFVFVAIVVAYSTLMNGRWGATVGKMAIGAVIINTDGTPIGYGKALGRAFAEMLSGIILYIGYLMAAFDGQKRALHDQICGTLVVARR